MRRALGLVLLVGCAHPRPDVNPNPAMFAALPCHEKGVSTAMGDDHLPPIAPGGEVWTCDGRLMRDQHGRVIWFDKQRVAILTRTPTPEDR